MMEHSKEPWTVGSKVDRAIYGADGAVVAMCDSLYEAASDSANARRIVACVNACAGLDTALLENITMLGDTLKDRIDVLRNEANQRDQLLAALESMLEIYENPAPFSGKTGEERMIILEQQSAKVHAATSAARDAITTVKGTPC